MAGLGVTRERARLRYLPPSQPKLVHRRVSMPGAEQWHTDTGQQLIGYRRNMKSSGGFGEPTEPDAVATAIAKHLRSTREPFEAVATAN